MTTKGKEIKGLQFDSERYRFILEHVGDLITTHRPGDWAYTAMNPMVNEISGYTPEELLGKPVYDFFHPDDAEAMKNKLIPAIYQHGSRTFRYRSRRKDGKYYWVESTHRSIRDERTGELKEIIAVTRDISVQMEAERVNKRLAAVVQASFDIIIFCDRKARVTYMNSTAMNALGFSDQDQIRCDLWDLLSVESRQKLKTLVFQVAEAKGSWHGSLRLKSPRAPQRYWVLEQVFAQSCDGNAECSPRADFFSLIIRDLTEQKRVEREMRERQAELAHATRLMTLGEMASGLAHEINQPLATTLNYARGTLRQLDQGQSLGVEKLRRVMNAIIKQAQRAADIIKRLRSMVKKAPYQRCRFQLESLCRDVVGFVQRELTELTIELEIKGCRSVVEIEADPIQIEQVLINLLRNSIDAYREQQRPQKRIILELIREAATVIIRVTDFAKGVAAEKIPCLFEPYYTSKQAGLGMGLSISRTIIEAHGGQITVASDGNSYTTFEIQLPLPESALDKEPLVE